MENRFCRFPPCYTDEGVESEREVRSTGIKCNTYPCVQTSNSTVDIDVVYANAGDITAELSVPCTFPFKYKGEEFDTCISTPSPQYRHGALQTGSRQWCGLTPNLDLTDATRRQWGVCAADQIGTWSTWATEGCSQFCRLSQSRRCLVEPCNGEKIKSNEPCSTGECEQPQWGEWAPWSCECDGTRKRERKCDGGQFKLSCLGPPVHSEKVDGENVESCDMSKIDKCSPDQLKSYLDFGNELRAMYGNWSTGIDTDIVTLLSSNYDKWITRIQSKKKWDRIYEIWRERYDMYSEDAGEVMYVGFGLIGLVAFGQVWQWWQLRRLMMDVPMPTDYRYSDLESESE